MPKLSVLVTFCNQKDYIKENLDSIISQDVDFEYEILICLDGKCQESENIINEYINKYPFIKLFKTDNSNWDTINIIKASRNRLKLLVEAKGEYFCFIDGDDFYIGKNRFQRLVDYLDENKEDIGVFHDICTFDNKTGSIINVEKFCDKERSFNAEEYLKIKNHISFTAYIFRNNFCGQIPADLNKDAINDTSFIYYMLRYGKVYRMSGAMLACRININSIYNNLSVNIQNLYTLMFSEINQKILPCYQKYICKKIRHLLKESFFYFHKVNKDENEELKKIFDVAKTQNCYFTYNILNYKNLSLKEKIKFRIKLLLAIKFYIYPQKFKKITIFYFDGRPNFGDMLNIYILQRIFGFHCENMNIYTTELIGIGSLMEHVLNKAKGLTRKLKIFSTGFMFDESEFKLKLRTKFVNFKWIALRGKYTYNRIKKYFKSADLSKTVIGDAGLLCYKLVDNSKIEKNHNVGIVLHYVDINEKAINNINLENYKFIDIQDSPIKVLYEISQCDFILSSAMHGLIASDALNIPNKWIQLSDKIAGNNYKFRDYYSSLNIENPEPVDLRKETITDEDIIKFKEDYFAGNRYEKVKTIQDKLLNCIKYLEH